MEKKRRYIACLDIGSWYTKMVVWIEPETPQDKPVVYTQLCRSQGAVAGLVCNPTDAVKGIRSLVQIFYEKLGFHIERVYLAYFGRAETMTLYRVSTNCTTKDDTGFNYISASDIEQLYKLSEDCRLAQGLERFDREAIRFYRDGKEITERESVQDSYADVAACDFNIYAGEKNDLKKLRKPLRQCGLSIQQVVTPMRLLQRLLIPKLRQELYTAFLNVGAEKLQLGVFVGGSLAYYRVFEGSSSIGASHLTKQLNTTYNCGVDSAEKMKRVDISFELSEPLTHPIPQYLVPASEDDTPSPLIVVLPIVAKWMKFVAAQFAEWDVVRGLMNGNGLYVVGGGLGFQHIETYLKDLFKLYGQPIKVSLFPDPPFHLEPCLANQGQDGSQFYTMALAMLHMALEEETEEQYAYYEVQVDEPEAEEMPQPSPEAEGESPEPGAEPDPSPEAEDGISLIASYWQRLRRRADRLLKDDDDPTFQS